MNTNRFTSPNRIARCLSCAVAVAGLGACSPAPDSSSPGEVMTTTEAVALGPENLSISAGLDFTCAFGLDGFVRCAGNNDLGQIGSPNLGVLVNTPALAPVYKVMQIASGGGHSCATASGGGVRCWGRNLDGESGGGGRGIFTYVAAGRAHSCAIQTGDVYCWGRNDFGQLGVPIGPPVTGPSVRVPLPSGEAVGVTAGAFHSCAVLRSGDVYCWGDNSYGQLGIGSVGGTCGPTMALMRSPAARVSAGDTYTCALEADGSAVCWGNNRTGQIGVPPLFTERVYDHPVGVDKQAKAIATGVDHTCVADMFDPVVRCWGTNGDGQLGDGTTTSYFSALTFVGEVLDVVAGARHTCALVTPFSGPFASGHIFCWGDGRQGQLGTGAPEDHQLSPAVSRL